jgi:uncharacterized protein YoxC
LKEDLIRLETQTETPQLTEEKKKQLEEDINTKKQNIEDHKTRLARIQSGKSDSITLRHCTPERISEIEKKLKERIELEVTKCNVKKELAPGDGAKKTQLQIFIDCCGLYDKTWIKEVMRIQY